jgi:hypothetical protein
VSQLLFKEDDMIDTAIGCSDGAGAKPRDGDVNRRGVAFTFATGEKVMHVSEVILNVVTGGLKRRLTLQHFDWVHSGHDEVALRVLVGEFLHQFVRSDHRRNVIEVVNGMVAEVRITDPHAWKSGRVLSFIDWVLDRSGRWEQLEFGDFGGNDTVAMGRKVLAHSMHLPLNDALVECMWTFGSVRIWKLHAKMLQDVVLASRDIVRSGLMGNLSGAIVVYKVPVHDGILLWGAGKEGRGQGGADGDILIVVLLDVTTGGNATGRVAEATHRVAARIGARGFVDDVTDLL